MLVKPFKGLRPPREFVEEVASRPDDVLSSEEARQEAQGNEKSLYRIIKPEIEFPTGKDEHDPNVYEKAGENFRMFQEKGWLIQDEREIYYLYAQTRDGKTQYGWVVGVHVKEYTSGKVKKHELTRHDKEEDRMKHVRVTNANVEPVFFAYRYNEALDEIAREVIVREPEYDFVSVDGVGHHLWLVPGEEEIQRVTNAFAAIPELYIADGHHRTAAAALVGAEKARNNPHHTGNEEYNYFMAVCFPDNQLTIIDYNRVVKDLNGMTPDEFIQKLERDFVVIPTGSEIQRPTERRNFSIYLDGRAFSLTVRPGLYEDNNPINQLDVTIASNLILGELLGIKDLRSDQRVDFVGGIRGLDALKERVDSGEMALALALYPVSMEQLMEIADTGNIMPPKTTWFEPKLRSGLVIHKLEE